VKMIPAQHDQNVSSRVPRADKKSPNKNPAIDRESTDSQSDFKSEISSGEA